MLPEGHAPEELLLYFLVNAAASGAGYAVGSPLGWHQVQIDAPRLNRTGALELMIHMNQWLSRGLKPLLLWIYRLQGAGNDAGFRPYRLGQFETHAVFS